MSIIEEPFAEEPPINKPTPEELIISLQAKISQLEKENEEITSRNEGYKIQIAELEKDSEKFSLEILQWPDKYAAHKEIYNLREQILENQFTEMVITKEQIKTELVLKVDELTAQVALKREG